MKYLKTFEKNNNLYKKYIIVDFFLSEIERIYMLKTLPISTKEKLYYNKFYYYDSYSRNKNKLSKYWKNKRMYNANTIDRDQSYKENDCGSRSLSWLIIFRRYGEKIINII